LEKSRSRIFRFPQGTASRLRLHGIPPTGYGIPPTLVRHPAYGAIL